MLIWSKRALVEEDNAKRSNPKYQTSLLAIAVKSAGLISMDHRVSYYERVSFNLSTLS